MKIEIASLMLTTITLAMFGLVVFSLIYAERVAMGPSTSLFMETQSAAQSFVLAAQAYGNSGVGNGFRNGVYGANLGVNPDYRFNKYYGPYYDQTGGYYGSIGQQCAWNGWVYFCDYNSESFY